MGRENAVITEPNVAVLFDRFGFRVERTHLVNSEGVPYMRRWLLRHPWGNVRLHNIRRSDSDRALHDHPFDFVSLILWGAYVEHRPATADPCGPTFERRYRMGQLNRCVAEQPHRLELREGPVWTLVFCQKKRRDWGFHSPDGWVHWLDWETRYAVNGYGDRAAV